ncbi:TPA: hypothetical protein QDB13_002218 [Burkholderia vietnamiensis]|nr:hypothetical protein [Burkholderia vietnamiensis]
MTTEHQIEEVLERYLERTPVFAGDRAKAVASGMSVRDVISVQLKNACGHPTASLTRYYEDEGKGPERKTWKPWPATFDIKLVGREWTVRCSSGLPND